MTENEPEFDVDSTNSDLESQLLRLRGKHTMD